MRPGASGEVYFSGQPPLPWEERNFVRKRAMRQLSERLFPEPSLIRQAFENIAGLRFVEQGENFAPDGRHEILIDIWAGPGFDEERFLRDVDECIRSLARMHVEHERRLDRIRDDAERWRLVRMLARRGGNSAQRRRRFRVLRTLVPRAEKIAEKQGRRAGLDWLRIQAATRKTKGLNGVASSGQTVFRFRR